MPFITRLTGVLVLSAVAAGCVRQARPDPALSPRLTLEEATALLPAHVPDREGWALDVLTALDAHRLHPDLAAVCSVFAVIEQESGYKANPPVAQLARIVEARLEEEASRLGPLGPPTMQKLLDAKPAGAKETFAGRLRKVKTERDLDLVFRDMLRFYENEYAITYKLMDFAHGASGRGGLSALNPITTAGSMQVAVQYAVELSEQKDEALEEWEIRDRLYTRGGGVYYGAARLLDYPADYSEPVFRFADFNAGLYASRNAALQEQLAQLTSRKLALDGDLLAYDRSGEPAEQDSNSLKALLAFRAQYLPELSERQVRREVLQEKSHTFEQTQTYRAVRAAWEKKTGKPAPYARLPEVMLKSPKLSRDRSTAWFAKSVLRRYDACQTRARR